MLLVAEVVHPAVQGVDGQLGGRVAVVHTVAVGQRPHGPLVGHRGHAALRKADGDGEDHEGHARDAEAGGVVVAQADHGRQDQQGHQVHHLDQRVQGGPGCVLERVAHGVADDGGLVGLGALAPFVAVLDVLLGVVPGAA